MFKLFILLLSLSVASAVSFSTRVAAGEDDFNQLITVDSNTQRIDGKKKLSVFEGDVIISQGSLLIKADEVEVDASAGEGNEIFIARGKPASYSQDLDDGQRVVASANELKYVVVNRTITLSGSAQLLRDASSVSGDSIIYDMINEQLVAESSNKEDGRVTTVFRPDALPREKEQEKEDDTP